MIIIDQLKIFKFKPVTKHKLLFLLVWNWGLILHILNLSSYISTCIHVYVQGLYNNLIIQYLFFHLC